MKIQSFKQLIVWQKSIQLVKEVYNITELLPKSELYCLTSQMRRSAISIPSNIAEGYKRKNRAEYIQFLYIANASSAELETQIIIMKEVYPSISSGEIESLSDEVQKMLSAMLIKFRSTPYTLHSTPYV